MHAGAFSDEEVDRARHYLAGSWVFDYQTVEQRAERLMELERWGLDRSTSRSAGPSGSARVTTEPGPAGRPGPHRPFGDDPGRVRADPTRRRGSPRRSVLDSGLGESAVRVDS